MHRKELSQFLTDRRRRVAGLRRDEVAVLAELIRVARVFDHPIAGELSLAWDALTCMADPDQQLIVWSAEPDPRAYEGLCFLSSWAAATAANS
ncbi:hypothetical protein ACIGMX_38510 [Streptomyces aquilus]|uniref:hypothetical protein n=1 Tax=Streptomyces aquilus TaxID=2548456 RepID=UPI00104A69FD